jgi:hypothetical protein
MSVKDYILDRTEKLLKWLFFSVVISLLPLGLSSAILFLNNLNFTFLNLISRGELQFISTSLLANGFGELLCNEANGKIPRLILGGMSAVLIICSTCWYGSIVLSSVQSVAVSSQVDFVYYSLVTLVSSLFLSCICVLFGE